MNFKHGHNCRGKETPTHQAWDNMIQRCTNSNVCNFERYGGRGITVCERWKEFVNFLEDMGKCPKGLTIDRIDNNGNYEPGNCRWTTHCKQNQNSTNTKLTWKTVRAIRELIHRKCPVTQTRLAEWFGVVPPTISHVVNGKTWQELSC